MDDYHYVYLSTCPEYRLYIGVRTSNCKPEEDSYMGSFVDDTFKPTTKYILKTFDSRYDADLYEVFLHELWDVAINPLFVNRSKALMNGWSTYGIPKSLKMRQRISDTLKGRKHTPEQYQNYLNAMKGKPNGMQDKNHSEESKQKMSEFRKCYYEKNPHPSLGVSPKEESVIASVVAQGGKIHKWYHPDHGYRECYAFQLIREFSYLSGPKLSNVIHGKRNHHQNWRIVNE